jgi:hypothetical protein
MIGVPSPERDACSRWEINRRGLKKLVDKGVEGTAIGGGVAEVQVAEAGKPLRVVKGVMVVESLGRTLKIADVIGETNCEFRELYDESSL